MSKMSRELLDSMDRFRLEQNEMASSRRDEKSSRTQTRHATAGSAR
jgi:hypothetical protein